MRRRKDAKSFRTLSASLRENNLFFIVVVGLQGTNAVEASNLAKTLNAHSRTPNFEVGRSVFDVFSNNVFSELAYSIVTSNDGLIV